jgi:hypothetical protein
MEDLEKEWAELTPPPPAPLPATQQPVPSTVPLNPPPPPITGKGVWTNMTNFVQTQAAAHPTVTNGCRWLQQQVVQFAKSSLRYAMVLFLVIFVLLRCLAPQFLYYRSPNKEEPPRFAWDKAAFISLAVAVGYVLLPYGYQLVKYFLLS